MRRSTLHRAYALPLCLMLSGILAGAFVVYITRLKSAVSTTTLSIGRRQVFYVADAVARAATEVASAKLSTMPPVDATSSPAQQSAFFAAQTTELQTTLDANQTLLTPAGYKLHNLRISGLGTRTQTTLRSGPFKGMNAQVQPFTIAVDVSKDGGNQALASMQSSIDRATLSMFQFFAFIDGYAFIFNGPGAKYSGRMHSNGNMCLGAGSTTYMERLTSGGGIYKLKGSGCRNEKSGSGGDVLVAKIDLASGISSFPPGGAAGDFKKVNDQNLADSSAWITEAAAWAGHITDRTHGVPVLKAPITGSPRAQRGRNALGALTDNSNTSRFLIDPVLVGEAGDVQQQKIAWKADLRIINGVWYLRDPDRPTELGRPIWSDRPGKTASRADERWYELGNSVGQDDIFPAGPRPRRYSYYRTKQLNSAALDTFVTTAAGAPIVSYGTLFRDEAITPSRWVPGFYPTSALAGCTKTPCLQTIAANTPSEALQGTRSGIRSAWDEVGVLNNAADCDVAVNRKATLGFNVVDAAKTRLFNMLPLNFDVAALQNALTDTGVGELGAVFAGRPEGFNGIIFISSTWPGSANGYGLSGAPDRATYWPPQGAQADTVSSDGTTTGQPSLGLTAQANETVTTTTPSEPTAGAAPFQQSLPKVFCSDDPTLTATAKRQMATFDATSKVFATGTTGAFKAPSCTSPASLGTTYNAVRVINARVLKKTTLPRGLSIVTNLPMFLVGDINSSSVPADTPAQVQPTSASSGTDITNAANWVPFMLGGDTIGLLSNAWNDSEAPWNSSTKTWYSQRIPADTTYIGQFLYGWAESAKAPNGVGCREELSYSMRLHEDWSANANLKRTVRGSIFVGWNSVYGQPFSDVHESQGGWHDGAGDKKIYGFDLRLDVLANQPPGAPQFQVAATQTFRRN